MSMKDFAHHIIAVANENNLPITNLQLQKVMYFTFKDALINQTYDKKWFDTVYDSPFLVWRYGPVEKDIYETYNIYGASPIIEKNEINPKFNRLNKFIIEKLKKDPFVLVNQSHQEKFWEDNKKEICGWRSDVKYSLDNIKLGA